MENICLLVSQNDCNNNCKRCGWNPSEAKKRKKILAENGLTLCEDGLKRLILPKVECEGCDDGKG